MSSELERLMRATITDARNWTYRAVRPLPIPAAWQPGQRVASDCSWGVRLLYRWAKLPDPMQAGYAGGGNSSTLAIRNPHLRSPGELQVGDAVTVGVNGGTHAALVLEAGSDPLLWSDGHQGAPNAYRLSADRRSPKQYLRLPRPAPAPPTPEQRLREREGWFAWVAWRLGEGDWHRYGAASAKIRPNVPARIPLAWWARYGHFLLARNRGNRPRGPRVGSRAL